MIEPVPEPALAREDQRGEHTEDDRHAECRVDDEDCRPAHRKIREGQEGLRSVDGEAVEERVGDEREECEEQPAPPERTGRRVDADRRPGDDRGRQDEYREGMGIAAVPGEGGDRVRERPENVEVREEPAESSPDRRPPPDLAPEGRFPNGSAEGDLGNDVHGARSARAGVGRPGGARRKLRVGLVVARQQHQRCAGARAEAPRLFRRPQLLGDGSDGAKDRRPSRQAR